MLGRVTSLVTKFRAASLQNRFLVKVLTPPFVILLAISLVGYWQLDKAVRSTAVDSLRRASVSTAAKLEREFALREIILTTTGSELFNIKSDYANRHATLDTQHTECKNYVKSSNSYLNAPHNSCEPFFAQIAVATASGTKLPQAVEDGYAKTATTLNDQEQKDIKVRLDAFVSFFPETLVLLVTNKDGTVVSQAAHDEKEYQTDAASLASVAKQATKKSIEGTFASGNKRQVTFAYPIDEGAVLATYDLDHPTFVHTPWASAPIDTNQAYAVITDPTAKVSYPKLDNQVLYQSALDNQQSGQSAIFNDNGIQYLAVSESAGKSGWHVTIGSPAALVLSTLRSAELSAYVIIGLLLVSFLWVGTIFVKRTIRHILTLASGALIFASNKLDYKINMQGKADQEFTQLADTMNAMASRLQAAEQAIDQKNKEFISVATHELKAPMTAIIGSLSMVLEDGMGAIDDTARKLMGQAYEGTTRLRDLVSELLDIARLESGRAQFKPEPLDIFKEAEAMIAIQKLPAEQKNVTITHTPGGPLPRVIADKTKLEIVLTNFMSNAIKYNRSPGSVTITHALQNNMIVTSVSDTGLGIPQGQQANMFQKFFRVEADDRKGIPGTGLGMYITKQFIEAMGGTLRFESEAGKGTTFYFSLPTTPEPHMGVPGGPATSAEPPV